MAVMRALIVIGALIAVGMLQLVHAGGSKPSHTKRTISTVAGLHSVNTQATRVTGKSGDRVDFYFTTNAWPRYRATYWQKAGQTTSMFKFRVGLAAVTEYTGGSWSTANVVSRIQLAGRLPADWSNLAATQLTGYDGSSITQYSTTIWGTGRQSQATVTLATKWAPSYTTLKDTHNTSLAVQYAANSIKFDVIIDNYNFTTPNSQLALVTVVQSIQARHIDGTGWPSVNVGSGGSFEWFNQAWHQFKNGSAGFVEVQAGSLQPDDPTIYASPGQTDDDADASETTNIVIHTLTAAGSDPTTITWDPSLTTSETSGAGRVAVSGLMLFLLASIATLFA